MTERKSVQSASRPQQLRVRRGLLLGSFALGAVLVLGRAFQLQALEGEKWAKEATAQQRERVQLPARRGAIYDRDGVALALTYETFRISIAPRELHDRPHQSERVGRVDAGRQPPHRFSRICAVSVDPPLDP